MIRFEVRIISGPCRKRQNTDNLPFQYPDYRQADAVASAGQAGEGEDTKAQSKTQAEKERKKKMKASIAVEHVDIIRDEFWEARPWILAGSRGRQPVE